MADATISLEDKKYLVFEGGGGSGMAYVGALHALYDVRFDKKPTGDDFTWKFEGVAGSSVGAITALMVALDYTPAEIGNLIVRDGLFSSLFGEQVHVKHFCAAATPPPGRRWPMTGHYSHDFEPSGNNPDDRAKGLQAHGCPDWDPRRKAKEEAARSKPAPLPGAALQLPFLLMDLLQIEDGGELLKAMVPPYLKALATATFRTVRDADGKDGRPLLDTFSDQMWQALARALPEFLASRIGGRRDPLGLFGGYASLLAEDLEKMAAGASEEVKGAALLTQPAALLVLLMIVLLRPNSQGSADDVLNFEEGRRRPKGEDRAKVGKNPALYFVGAVLTILFHQSGRLHPNQNAMRGFARDTIGSPNFILPLKRGLTAEAPAERKEAWRALGRHCAKVLGRYILPKVGPVFDSLLGDGGLWHGDRMREILAFIVFNKVEVAGKRGFTQRDQLIFARRERSLIATLEQNESFVTADLFQLVRRRARIERRLERLSRRDARRDELGRRPDPFARTGRARSELDAIEAKLADITPSDALIAALGSGGAERLSPNEQLRAIREWFDFETMKAVTGKDLVVTGTNISTAYPVFFRESLTPDFPVTEAVRMSAGFPFVFKPTAVAYSPPAGKGRLRGSAAERERFYRLHYCGYFIDGGFLNNHPMHAFNGVVPRKAGTVAAPDSSEYNSPQEMLCAPFGTATLGLHLTNAVPVPCPFAGPFDETGGSRGLLKVLGGMMDTFYAAGSTLRFIDPEIERNTIAIKFGNLDLLDLKPDYFAVLDVQGRNYEDVFRRLTGSVGEDYGKQALDAMYGAFASLGAAQGGGEARRNQRRWKRAYQARDRLLQVPGD